MREPFVLGFLVQEIAAEDHAERCRVGEIEEAQRRDGDVELHRIDRDLEIAAVDAAPHHGSDHLDEGRVHRLDLGRFLQVFGAREVLGLKQRQELGIAQEVVPGELDQPPDGLRRFEMFEIEPALLAADLVIGAFEDREIEFVLVADVI